MNLQKSTKELKLKHIGKNGFENILSSKKLGLLLQWLDKNDFYIHYSNLNILYWSLVDIVDSILAKTNNQFYMANHRALKNDLYKIVKNDENFFLDTAKQYGYPNVQPNKLKHFLNWLYLFILNNLECLEYENGYYLVKFFESAIELDELIFIMYGTEHVLIDNLSEFYLMPLYIFKNSNHVFDEEHYIEEILAKTPLVEHGHVISNYSFINSQAEKAVQVSDVISGFLGKYFTFIKNTGTHDIKKFRVNLNVIQESNILFLKKLIDRSDNLSNGLLHSVVSNEEQQKNDFFLHNISCI